MRIVHPGILFFGQDGEEKVYCPVCKKEFPVGKGEECEHLKAAREAEFNDCFPLTASAGDSTSSTGMWKGM